MNLKKTRTIVTGGSRGIGFDIAKRLSKAGSKVSILDIVPPNTNLSALNKKLKGEVKYVECDLSKTKEIKLFFDKTKNNYKEFTILINNARYKTNSELYENSSQWNKSISIGLSAPFLVSQEVIKYSKMGGSIINICSIASKLVTDESPSYHVVKGGLLSLNRYLAVKAGPKNFTVNAILPGLIIQDDHQERFNSKENQAYKKMSINYQPMGSVGKQKDISDLVLFLSSKESRYISGSEINLDGAASVQDQFSLLNKSEK